MFLMLYRSGVYFLRLTAVFIFRPATEDPEAEKRFFPLVPTVNVEGGLNENPEVPEGGAGAADAGGFAPKVNTPGLFGKLKLVVLLPNWNTEPALGVPEPKAGCWAACCPNTEG